MFAQKLDYSIHSSWSFVFNIIIMCVWYLSIWIYNRWSSIVPLFQDRRIINDFMKKYIFPPTNSVFPWTEFTVRERKGNSFPYPSLHTQNIKMSQLNNRVSELMDEINSIKEQESKLRDKYDRCISYKFKVFSVQTAAAQFYPSLSISLS